MKVPRVLIDRLFRETERIAGAIVVRRERQCAAEPPRRFGEVVGLVEEASGQIRRLGVARILPDRGQPFLVGLAPALKLQVNHSQDAMRVSISRIQADGLGE